MARRITAGPAKVWVFLLSLAAAGSGLAAGGRASYTCLACGQSPIIGAIWTNRMGAFCTSCAQLETHCSICGLPVQPTVTKTPDGRLICPRDLPNVVLSHDEAKQLFENARYDLIDLFGRGFALNNPAVSVSVFDVDYWSEKNKGKGGATHKHGFSNSRQQPGGQWTHTVILLSGQLRPSTLAAAAHEYTHLWINEVRDKDRELDPDTKEAICELAAYKLLGAKSLAEPQALLLKNPYTHGQITNLVEIEKERGMAFVLDWVRHDTNRTLVLSSSSPRVPAPVVAPAAPPDVPTPAAAPAEQPRTLRLSGIMGSDRMRLAIINGLTFESNQVRTIRLPHKTIQVRCREILPKAVLITVDNAPTSITLTLGEAATIP